MSKDLGQRLRFGEGLSENPGQTAPLGLTRGSEKLRKGEGGWGMKTRANWHVGQEGIYRCPTGSVCCVVLLLKFSFLVIYFELVSFPTTLKTLNILFILFSTRDKTASYVCCMWKLAYYKQKCCILAKLLFDKNMKVNYVQMNAAEIKTHTCM